MTDQFPPVGSPAQQVDVQDSWRTYVDLFLRWWWLLLLSAIVAAGIAALISLNQTPLYRTSTKLLINLASSSNSAYQDMATSGRVAQTYAQWMSQRIVLERTIAQLGLPSDPDLLNEQITNLTATPMGDSQIIQLTVEGPSRELIVAFARALPQVFSLWVEEVQTSRYAETKTSLRARMDELTRQIETTQNALNLVEDSGELQDQLEYNRLAEELSRLRASYNGIADTYETLLLTEAQSVDTIAVIEEATTPEAPVYPQPLRNVGLAFVMGGMIAAGLVYLYELYTDRFRSVEEIRQILRMPVLGSIGRLSNSNSNTEEYSQQALAAINEPRSLIVEAFRRLRTNLRFAHVDSELHTLAVTSPNPNEGKSVIAANLAIVMAQAGLSVILVDADMRKPKQHRLFELPRMPGLTDALYNDTFDNLGLMLQETKVPSLRVLTVGEKAPNPAELLGSQRMQELTAKLREQADLIIFDTPPILAVTDSQVIGTQVQANMLVLDTKRTTRKMALTAVEALDHVNAPIIGVTLNRVDARARGYYYYYDYYEGTEGEDGDDSDSGSGRGKPQWWRPRNRQPQPSGKTREQEVYAARTLSSE